jgi:alkylation response protein AidB-like acyl-CoA dehydrogenase
VRATLTAEQESLAGAAREMGAGGIAAARTVLNGGRIPEEPSASLFAGFAGMAVPEESGGLGGGLVDMAILLEGLGRTVTPTPFVAHCIALQVGYAAGVDVTAAAGGATRWAFASAEAPDPGWGPWATTVSGGEIVGGKIGVPEGAECGAAVVTVGKDDVAVARPVDRVQRQVFDPTRPAADLRFEGIAEANGKGAQAGLERGIALLAAELCGVGRGAVEMAAAYAGIRQQFGQPIGRFQAVAHQLADAFTELETAWSLTLFACWALDAGDPRGRRAAHLAKARAGSAAIFAAERSTQIHGGIGITWETDPHIFLRRAMATDGWLGSQSFHRRRVGRDVLGAVQ